MAIGLGKMFGFHFLENFNYPYISKSISEFWRRWHISLGSWFRDYVYFPLGGSRKGELRTVINLSVVWFLTGFWHGANWTYMAWGVYFFIFISIEKLLAKNSNHKSQFNILKHTYTIIVVIFGWVLFRSDSLSNAIEYMQSMIGVNGNILFDDLAHLYIRENKYFLFAGILFSMPIVNIIKKKYEILVMKNNFNFKFVQYIYASIHTALYITIFIIAVSYIVKGAYNPFIYFNF